MLVVASWCYWLLVVAGCFCLLLAGLATSGCLLSLVLVIGLCPASRAYF
nr:MAG TPA: Dual oxidase maturation factor [Caudoviricetes sp.]